MMSVDTRRDRGQRAALLRAKAWYTPRFTTAIAAGPAATPDVTWTSWVTHHAVVTATVAVGGDEHPPDTATTAYRQVIAVQRPVGAHGWRPAPITTVVFVTLRRIGAHWLLDATQTS